MGRLTWDAYWAFVRRIPRDETPESKAMQMANEILFADNVRRIVGLTPDA